MGKATNSLVQLPAMTINNSQLLAGHSSSISTLTANSSINTPLLYQPVDTFMSSGGANGGAWVEIMKRKKRKQIMEKNLPVKGEGTL